MKEILKYSLLKILDDIGLYSYITVFITCLFIGLIGILDAHHKEVITKLDDIDNKEIEFECIK